MIRTRFVRVLAVIAASCVYAPAATADFPVIRFWPDGDFPCDTTLQACIDGAGPDDQIRIATDGPILEEIAFSKPLELVAQSGYHPLISSAGGIRVTATGNQTIRIDGLGFDHCGVTVKQASAGAVTLEITNNNFVGGGIDVGNDINQTGLGPVSLDVSGNTMSDDASSGQPAIDVVNQTSSSDMSVSIADNTIEMGTSTNYAIRVDGRGSVDVIRNRISGTGMFFNAKPSILYVRALDNLVTGRAGPGDGIDGVGVGNLQMMILNNTVANSAKGISLVNSSGQSSIDCEVANNVITGNGTAFDESGAIDLLTSQSNLLFGNTTNGFALDYSQIADPRYMSFYDFHVRPDSPAIDAGYDDYVPVDLLTDLDGNPRIQGSHVDIGAYEAPEPSANLSAMADLSVLAALGLCRRSSGRFE